MFSLGKSASYLRCEFLHPGGADPLTILERHHAGFTAADLEFVYFKGNDSLLHYTLVDWSSGARRMVDLYHQSRGLWHKRKHPGEWLYAAYRGRFHTSGEQEAAGFGRSDRLEPTEVGVRVTYNGLAYIGRETFSVVSTCHATGLVSGGRADAHAANLGILLEAFTAAWTASRPLFGWVGVGGGQETDVPPMTGTNRVPRNAWFVFYPPADAGRMLAAARRSSHAFTTLQLEDGSVLLENERRRPRGLGTTIRDQERSNP